MDLLIQVVVLLLELLQRFVLSSCGSGEVVSAGIEQVFCQSPGLVGLSHRAERTGHRGVALLLGQHGLLVELLHLLKLICDQTRICKRMFRL